MELEPGMEPAPSRLPKAQVCESKKLMVNRVAANHKGQLNDCFLRAINISDLNPVTHGNRNPAKQPPKVLRSPLFSLAAL